MANFVKKALESLLGWGEQGFLPEYVPNHELTSGMIPSRDAPWHEIARFSLTFDGYWRKGSFNRCAEVPWSRECATLSEMRACLFHELNRANSPGGPCESGTEGFIRDLLDRMREKVGRDERD